MTIHNANCLDFMTTMPENSVDSVITDPPYGLSFMGKDWDHGVPVNLDGLKLSKSKHREQRLASLGNSIVPQVAIEIMRAIKNSDLE